MPWRGFQSFWRVRRLKKGQSEVISGISQQGTRNTMPFVKCNVDGCNTKLQPIQKLDPRDRETWLYPECDVCFRPACEQHSTEIGGRIVCDRCHRKMDDGQPPWLDLGMDRITRPE